MKYDVFISYSRKDSETVEQIAKRFSENKISFFIDREDISGGEEFSPVLAENIDDSIVFLFIGSKNSYTSTWALDELFYALDSINKGESADKDEKTILPYLIDDEPIPNYIKLRISRLNIRNSKEHPLEKLVEDIKVAIEKTRPKNTEEDVTTAKKIAKCIVSSSHGVGDKIETLTSLAETSHSVFSKGYGRIHEAEVYYLNAIELLENHKEELKYSDRNNSLYVELANIKKELRDFESAEDLYLKYINVCSNTNTSGRRLFRSSKMIECLLNLAEVQSSIQKYNEAELNCKKVFEIFASSELRYGVSRDALRLVELRVEALREQGKNEEVNKVQDEILNLFRDRPSRERGFSFSDMLVDFADYCKKENQWDNALKYLKEASLTSNDISILLKLAEAYNALDNIQEAHETYMKAFSQMMKDSEVSSFDFDFNSTLHTVVHFLNENKFFIEIDKCYQLALAKCQIDAYNEVIDNSEIVNVYSDYADWLLGCKKWNEAKCCYKDCLNILESTKSSKQFYINYFEISCKLALVYHFLDMNSYAKEEVTLAITKCLTGFKEMVLRALRSLYDCWKQFVTNGFVEGAKMIMNCLMEHFGEVVFDDKEDEASYCTCFGWYMLMMEEYGIAQKPLENSLKLEQKLNRGEGYIANAKNNLALLYIHIGRIKEAEKLLTEALMVFEKLAENENYYIHNLAETQNYFGQLMMAQGKYADAECYFEKSHTNYMKASSIDDKYKKEEEETAVLLEKARAQVSSIN